MMYSFVALTNTNHIKRKMKTKIWTLGLVALLGLTLASCSKKGCTDEVATNYDSEAKKDDGTCEYATSNTLNGDITEDMTLEKENPNGETIEWTLSGGVHVKDGVTLTIEPGVTISSDPNETVAYLLIEQGGKIVADGTADEPIVFTSGQSNPARGDWGGIIICGKAPINKGTTATAEVGDVIYGGSDAADNSGTLRYVRVEYTGNAINDEKEHNGFTFNGVGSGTTAEYLQAYMGGDDGFEWFGGTVDCSYLISSGSKDDSFDWTYGWSGNGNEWIAEQASDEGDRGIEADNQSGANAVTPFSNPTLTNITLSGRSNSNSDGMKLREGTKGNISNVVITGFKDGVEIQHNQTVSNAASGSLVLSNLSISNVGGQFKIDTPANAADSTAAATMVEGAITGSATGASTSWRGTWAKSL